MQPDEKLRLLKYLQDALDACIELQANTLNATAKNYEYSNIKWLAERGIEIISEALKRASYIETKLPVTSLAKVFATRNKIAHEYDIIDPYLLYTIVQKSIPILIKELKDYIEFLETN